MYGDVIWWGGVISSADNTLQCRDFLEENLTILIEILIKNKLINSNSALV